MDTIQSHVVNFPDEIWETISAIIEGDDEIWEKILAIIKGDVISFPDEIWEKILARLPIASLIRARTVCKEWKAIVDSQFFNTIYRQEAAQNFFFLPFFRYNGFKDGISALCSAETNRWYTIPFSQASLTLRLRRIGCAGGPFLVIETRNNDIVVCNIITKTHRILPPRLPTNHFYLARAIVVLNNGHYKVLVVNFRGHAQLYDSENNSWEICVQLNNGLYCYKGSVYLNDLLYFMSDDERSLIAIDIHGDRTWNVVQQNMPDGLLQPFVMEHGGLLLLVGGIQENRVLRSINIWQLHQLQWRIVSTMPNCLLRGFQRPKEICIRIIGLRGKICFFKKKYSSCPCMYDIPARKWVEQLPSLPNARGTCLHWIGLAIEPRLHTE